MRISLLFSAVACLLVIGCGAPSLLITPVSNTSSLQETVVQPGSGWAGDKIAIIEIEGMISNSRSGGLLGPGENKISLFNQQIDQAARDKRVKAVVLRLNTPGGTVTGSDTIYQLVRRFRQRTGKPVVASVQEIAASGGYYIALSADEIMVQPTSVVGSIGVIFNSFEFSGGLSKLGIRTDAIKSGRYKDMGSPLRPLPADERAIMQGLVDEYFAIFSSLVRESRPGMSEENFKLATDGRILSGRQAVEIGLADKTGLLADAINRARVLGNAKTAKAVMYKRPHGYSGSIYASSPTGQPTAETLTVRLPESVEPLPGGFYYLWEAGR